MRFLAHKRRHTPSVIIVALIDVLIVLLIFLMVTTTFKQHPQLKLTLPESSQAKKPGAGENPVVEVSIDKEGNLRYGENAQPVTLEQLADRLREAAAKNPQVTLAINADEAAPWGKVVKVRDAAVEAKIKSLVAYTREKTKP
ncbi:MAG TPA: biopolymer transporter ExbD [Verrucomicrobiae bacterium]|nr:biopolymer transporter ExbD [Verrucomicrobiae bacterium]